jgi:hypothetical protein
VPQGRSGQVRKISPPPHRDSIPGPGCPGPEIRCMSVSCNRVLLPYGRGCGPYVEDLHGSTFVLAINTRPRHFTRVYFGGCIKTVEGWGGGGCLVNKFGWCVISWAEV